MLLAESLLGSSSAGESVFIEDVFSTWLYTGNGSTQTITNGIDLAGKGGLVWAKRRDAATSHVWIDTARGPLNYIESNGTSSQAVFNNSLTSFTGSGYTVGSALNYNGSDVPMVSWTFRKQPKFFDIVTFTAPAVGVVATISHSLGSVPGCIIMKSTTNASNWVVLHRYDQTMFGELNTTSAFQSSGFNANFTSTSFEVRGGFNITANSGTYVAYLFAHNAGGFGATGADNVISCGSYTGNGSATGPIITLGYEPQWLLVKRTSSIAPWYLVDNMRGLALTGNGNTLWPNDTSAENGYVSFRWAEAQATGFQIVSNDTEVNASGNTYIYIAIRRGPMRTPTSGTSVFNPVVYTGTNVDNRLVDTTIAPDMVWVRQRNDSVLLGMVVGDRLRAQPYLLTASTAAEVNDADAFDAQLVDAVEYGNAFSAMNGFWCGNDATAKLNANTSPNNHVAEAFRRAPGFFDITCYTGNGVAGRTVNHNLGVAPELMIVRRRNASEMWPVYAAPLGATKYLILDTQDKDTIDPIWNNTSPTSSVFSLWTYDAVNASGSTYVAYLFASAPGVSKVGSFTGTGATQTIDCGFAAGARFVLIKRTDAAGGWYVWDSARGIVAGNDPYLLLNSTAAEVTNTDWVDTAASGFELSNSGGNLVNINGASYIFLAIA